MTPDTILNRRAEATYEVVAGEAMLIHLDTGTFYSLNAVGTQFWQRLDGRQTIAEHAAVLAAQYRVAVERVQADLIRLAEKLTAEQLAAVAS